jgi:hypothetical protein
LIAFRKPIRAQKRLVGFAPRVEPTFKRLGVDACLPEPSGGPLTDMAAVPAIDDDALAGKIVGPCRDGLGFHVPRSGQQSPA